MSKGVCSSKLGTCQGPTTSSCKQAETKRLCHSLPSRQQGTGRGSQVVNPACYALLLPPAPPPGQAPAPGPACPKTLAAAAAAAKHTHTSKQVLSSAQRHRLWQNASSAPSRLPVNSSSSAYLPGLGCLHIAAQAAGQVMPCHNSHLHGLHPCHIHAISHATHHARQTFFLAAQRSMGTQQAGQQAGTLHWARRPAEKRWRDINERMRKNWKVQARCEHALDASYNLVGDETSRCNTQFELEHSPTKVLQQAACSRSRR